MLKYITWHPSTISRKFASPVGSRISMLPPGRERSWIMSSSVLVFLAGVTHLLACPVCMWQMLFPWLKPRAVEDDKWCRSLVKMWQILHVCADASGLCRRDWDVLISRMKTGCWFLLHNIDCGEVNGPQDLNSEYWEPPKPILRLENMFKSVLYRAYHSIATWYGIDCFKLADDWMRQVILTCWLLASHCHWTTVGFTCVNVVAAITEFQLCNHHNTLCFVLIFIWCQFTVKQTPINNRIFHWALTLLMSSSLETPQNPCRTSECLCDLNGWRCFR